MSAWLLVLYLYGGVYPPVTVPAIESEAECHRVAGEIEKRAIIRLRGSKHICIEYFVVKP